MKRGQVFNALFISPWAKKRKDRSRTCKLSDFLRALTLFGFSPQLALIHEERHSNAQFYDYQRLRAELRILRLF